MATTSRRTDRNASRAGTMAVPPAPCPYRRSCQSRAREDWGPRSRRARARPRLRIEGPSQRSGGGGRDAASGEHGHSSSRRRWRYARTCGTRTCGARNVRVVGEPWADVAPHESRRRSTQRRRALPARPSAPESASQTAASRRERRTARGPPAPMYRRGAARPDRVKGGVTSHRRDRSSGSFAFTGFPSGRREGGATLDVGDPHGPRALPEHPGDFVDAEAASTRSITTSA